MALIRPWSGRIGGYVACFRKFALYCIVLLDDMLARRTAHAAGLQVWGTLKVLLEMKAQGLVNRVEPYVNRLTDAGMWVSDVVKRRILVLAREL